MSIIKIPAKVSKRPLHNPQCKAGFAIYAITVIAVILASPIGTADAKPEKDDMTIVTRVMAGTGFTKSNYDFSGMKNSNSHQSAQVLFYVSDTKAAGVEFGRHRAFTSDQANFQYRTVGIVLEATLFGFWLNQIGTIGYFGEGDNKNNPVGLRASTGLEHRFNNRVSAFALLRNDIIYDTETIYLNNIEIGIGIWFGTGVNQKDRQRRYW